MPACGAGPRPEKNNVAIEPQEGYIVSGCWELNGNSGLTSDKRKEKDENTL
jgi:hypothetical protein